MEYWIKAVSVWMLGFFPLTEIYIAVPAGLAMGLDAASAVFWGVAGNYVPVLLLHYGYGRLLQIARIREWLRRLHSPKLKRQMDRRGFWFVLLITPWSGVWIMAATVKLAGMRDRPFLIASFLSIAGYAVIIAAIIALGVEGVDVAPET